MEHVNINIESKKLFMMEALQLNTRKILDRKTFNEIYSTYYQDLMKRFMFLIGSRERAEDIIQEVFLKVWQQRQQVNFELSLRAYMMRIGHNLIMDYYRHHKVEKQFESRYNKQKRRSFIDEDALFNEDKMSRIEEIVNKLPPKRKLIFQLCKFEEKSYKEVSELLNISEHTICDHIVKSKRFIKSELGLMKGNRIYNGRS